MYKIAVIPGDGTGPEVTDEALKVLSAAASRDGIEYDLTHYDFGGDRYLSTGEILPDGAVEDLSLYNYREKKCIQKKLLQFNTSTDLIIFEKKY